MKIHGRVCEHARQDVSGGFHEWACFSAQQSAEKAVKAVFQKAGGDAWGHSVADLLRLLVVYAGAPRPDAYRTVRETLATRGLEPHVYTEREAEACAATLRRMTTDGLTLYETASMD